MSPSPSMLLAATARTRSSGSAPATRSRISANMPQLNYFDPTIYFLDLTYQAGDWGYGGGGSIPLRSDGWPTSVTAGSGVYAGFQARIPAAGQYVATFSGDGDIAVDFGGSHVSHTSNRYVFQLDGDADDRVAIVITRSNVANPVTNLVVVPIAFESTHATFKINTKFAEIIEPFQVLRFMDFFRINDVGEPYNTAQNWADRVPSTYALQGSYRGPAIERAVEICNLNQSDLWICIPLHATTNWIDGMVALVAANLSAPQKLYIEFGNELWNDAFSNGVDVLAIAVAAGFPNTYDSRFGYQTMMGRYARAAAVTAFGGATRVKHVIASHTGFDARIDITLDYPSTIGLFTDGHPAYQHADYLATAPYVSGERSGDPATVTDTAAQIVSKMRTIDIPAVLGDVVRNAAQATSRGLGFCAYEMGQHLYYWDSSDTTMQNKLRDANRHTTMYEAMTELLNGLGAEMDGPIAIYTICGFYSYFGYWGWMEDMYQAIGTRACPKMDAAVDWNAANGGP